MRVGTVRATGAPVPVYLIETDDGRHVLVDTGYPRAAAGPVEPAEAVDRQLARLGIAPADIDYVVCSHLDPDHAGNHDLFPNARFVVQDAHYRAALAGHPQRVRVARASWDRPGLRYERVSGDVRLLPGVDLVESSGHVPGHQSVLVHLANRPPVLLAVDAIPTTQALDPQRRPMYPFDLDETQVRAATRKLVDLAAREGAEIVCGHDAEQWATLPECYS